MQLNVEGFHFLTGYNCYTIVKNITIYIIQISTIPFKSEFNLAMENAFSRVLGHYSNRPGPKQTLSWPPILLNGGCPVQLSSVKVGLIGYNEDCCAMTEKLLHVDWLRASK